MVSSVSAEIETTLKSLKANHFEAYYAANAAEARKMIMELIPATSRVGAGDSTTLRQISILEELAKRGNEVINPFTQKTARERRELQKKTFGTDVFLSSSNALTEDGKIVNIDLNGNRVAGMIFAAPRVILPVGRNKIVKDTAAAIYRIKNVIAPAHARRRDRKTPCAITGKCNDCDSPDRICSITVVIEKKPLYADISIILIDEDLGLGWDPDWNEKRISEIRSSYSQNCHVFTQERTS